MEKQEFKLTPEQREEARKLLLRQMRLATIKRCRETGEPLPTQENEMTQRTKLQLLLNATEEVENSQVDHKEEED